MIRRNMLVLVAMLGLFAAAGTASAGAFISATESNPDRITHPTGYQGTGGTLTVDVCIDSNSANAAAMVIPVQNAIATWNDLTPTTGNIVFGGTDVPGSSIDFESVVLHELGHCIGLAHSNLASESGVATADQDYTKSADGTPNTFNLNAGSDGLLATGDDLRGNDINFQWYEDDENNPYFIAGSVVDSTTFSRSLGNLPAGDSFAAHAHRGNANSFGAPFTEGVMNQGTFSSEEQRLLSADDVSARRYAETGRDSLDGNSDDYTLVLNYAGSSAEPNCDINVAFDNGQTNFAVCQVSTARIGPPGSDDFRLTKADIFFSTNFAWYFTVETCGNGAFEGAEQCDDGNLIAGDGCNKSCSIETDWTCSGTPSMCMPICGNGDVQVGETCDDGGTTPGDGCDAVCQAETGWVCLGEPSTCTATCGDGFVVGAEGCDDGAIVPGDGCDAVCQVESGWLCSGEPSVCGAVCGDGVVTSSETCDDGGTTPGDGCDASCQLESGWMCSGMPSVCGATCGDSLITGSETCDDGGTTPGDGCDASCVTESGWLCSGEPSVCGEVCGDGILTSSETCDDGGTTPGDGCSASCQQEAGWLCSGAPSLCGETCGDGVIVGAETCDDGGTVPGDGCDDFCQVEPGFTCEGEPSVCTPPSVDALDTALRLLVGLGMLSLGLFWLVAGPRRASQAS